MGVKQRCDIKRHLATDHLTQPDGCPVCDVGSGVSDRTAMIIGVSVVVVEVAVLVVIAALLYR